jgi:hypothetical protein
MTNQVAKIGDNSKSIDDQIKEIVAKYVECDEQSALINDKRAELRAKAKDILGDEASRALQDEIARVKKDMKKKEGYDEARAEINRIIGAMDKDSLFAWQIKREKAKEEAMAERKKQRDAEKAQNETFKPATERKPKEVKSLGKALSEAHPVLQ